MRVSFGIIEGFGDREAKGTNHQALPKIDSAVSEVSVKASGARAGVAVDPIRPRGEQVTSRQRTSGG